MQNCEAIRSFRPDEPAIPPKRRNPPFVLEMLHRSHSGISPQTLIGRRIFSMEFGPVPGSINHCVVHALVYMSLKAHS
jgi:hypothetical protein